MNQVRTDDLPTRRFVLKRAVCLGLGASLLPRAGEAQVDAAARRPQAGDWLVRADDSSLAALAPSDFGEGRQTLAWAMDPTDRTVRSGSRLNQVLVLRIDEEQASPETRARAAEGVVAYTAICTHTGCEVTDWLADEGLLYCSCHYSRFDPRDGARVVDGPAPRALPALPLRVTDGRLVVAGPFTTRVGFEVA
jgi:Rieske Fe-S protein